MDALERIRKSHGITIEDEEKAMQELNNPSKHIEKPKTNKVIYLPVYPQAMDISPTCILRSALFGVVKKGRKKYIRDEIVASWKDTVIKYQGEQLNQYDLDVWMTALEIAKDHPLGTRIDITARGFLKKMGQTLGGSGQKRLFKSLKDMVACAVEIKIKRKIYVGSLIENFKLDEDTGQYIIQINPDIARLFEAGYTLQEKEARKVLTHDLTKWLLGYVNTHKATKTNPHRITLKQLQELCGADYGRLRDFKSKIINSIQQLLENKAIKGWGFTINKALEFWK